MYVSAISTICSAFSVKKWLPNKRDWFEVIDYVQREISQSDLPDIKLLKKNTQRVLLHLQNLHWQ